MIVHILNKMAGVTKKCCFKNYNFYFISTLVDQLIESCENSGFFYLKVDDNFGQNCLRMLQAAKEVFRLPTYEKVKLINDGTSQMFHKGTLGNY